MRKITAVSTGSCAMGQRVTSQKPIAKCQMPLADKIDKTAEFKRWLALFFIQRGKYKITEKGYAELAPKEKRQDDYIGEPSSARERSSRRDIIRSLTKKEIKEVVATKVEEMLREGRTEELYDNNYIDRGHKVGWDRKDVRIIVAKKLLELLGASPERLDKLREELNELILRSAREEPIDANKLQETLDEIRKNLSRIREITRDDFINNGLGGLIQCPDYKNSPYLVLVETEYAYSIEELLEHAKTGKFGTDKIYPWELTRVGNEFYKNKENRVVATKWLVWKLNKELKEITKEDFENSGLGGLLAQHYKNSPYFALVEAGYAYSIEELLEHAMDGEFKTDKIYPWEMNHARIYHEKEIRVTATKWLLWKLKKDIKHITADDFRSNGLIGLLSWHYKSSPYFALVEAGYAYSLEETLDHARSEKFASDKIYPWEMMGQMGFYEKQENRVAAIRWLVWKLGKETRRMIVDDFYSNGLSGLLGNHYRYSPYLALLDAGLVTPADEAYMRRHGQARFQEV